MIQKPRKPMPGGANAAGFNAYAAGNKVYGSGRSNPTAGMVDRKGYAARDAQAKLRRDAILRRIAAQGKK